MAMRELLGSDVNRLTALFAQICERHRRHRDYTRHELQRRSARGYRIASGIPDLRAG